MRIGRFSTGAEEAVGIIEGEHVTAIVGDGSCIDWALDKAELVRTGPSLPLDSIKLLAPVRRGRVFCVGFNYREHVAETAHDPSVHPVTFLRTTASIVGPDDPLWLPRSSECFDFEGELAAVIGRPGRHIPTSTALDHVYGYTCFMDGSIRDFQKHAVNAGKTFERTGAVGPWIVSRDEAPAWDGTIVSTRLNDQVVQQSTTNLMIFGLPELIAYLSKITTLMPGDVIATGTPAGVGSRRDPPLWMKAGDRVEVTVEGIGILSNRIIEEPAEVSLAKAG